MVRRSQILAQEKYDKKNTKQILLKLNIRNDADILARLDKESSKQGYIKRLVREDMRNTGSGILSIESIRCLMLPVVRKYEIDSVCLFGSYARNEAGPDSDIDILIDGGNYHGLVEYMNMIHDMETSLGKKVDVATQASLEKNESDADEMFRKNIERDKVKLI